MKAQQWERLADINTADEMVDIYTELVEQVLDKHAPIKKVIQHRNYQGGLSEETKHVMAARDNARKKQSGIIQKASKQSCKNGES